MRQLHRFIVVLALAGLLAAPASAASNMGSVDSEPAGPIFDALVMRPLGFVGLVASAALWVPTQAVTMAVRWDDRQKPVDLMLRKPYEWVFVDPLGTH